MKTGWGFFLSICITNEVFFSFLKKLWFLQSACTKIPVNVCYYLIILGKSRNMNLEQMKIISHFLRFFFNFLENGYLLSTFSLFRSKGKSSLVASQVKDRSLIPGPGTSTSCEHAPRKKKKKKAKGIFLFVYLKVYI